MQRASTGGGVRVDESTNGVRVSECMYAGAIKSDMTQLMSIKVDLKVVDADAICQPYQLRFQSTTCHSFIVTPIKQMLTSNTLARWWHIWLSIQLLLQSIIYQ